MKIIKFKQKRSYSYKRKILIKDLVLKMLVGIHNFEKKKKQRVRFNLVINIDQNLIPNDKDLKSIVNYEQVIKTIMRITSRKHYPLLETLAEKIFLKLFENLRIKKILLRIEKLDVIKNTTSVGIELEKTRSNEY
ncbi:dihydroneopterin aldolase [Pelagibacteraceae bacterium]|jgi:dihydroneopterin aldolase|nr:dihydroneopterin aldolase [Pelagibacteraceae bacterium]|tara:strand:- start:244 stop:648 length:405 start_codon:yes stop_codon:yes gene_type:complete